MISIALHFACNYPNHSPLHLWPPRHPSICGFYIYSHSLDPSLAATAAPRTHIILLLHITRVFVLLSLPPARNNLSTIKFICILRPQQTNDISTTHNLHELLLCYEQKPMSCHHQHHCRHCATKRPANDNNSMN